MKVIVSRASARSEEYETDLEISDKLVNQLLNLGEAIPILENSGSWDSGRERSDMFMLNINPETKEIELMIYDFYIE